MGMAYPIALLGLLTLPIMLVIHSLYRKKKRVMVSTLFLINEISAHQTQGARIKQIINSPSLWLQLLALILTVWISLGIFWDSSLESKKVALVLDCSASMRAFESGLDQKISEFLVELELKDESVEWTLMSSHLEDPLFYRGEYVDHMLSKIDADLFIHGVHDVLPAIELAQSIVGDAGLVVAVSDHVQVIPHKVHGLFVGKELDNVGFAGARVNLERDRSVWEVLVHNPSRHGQVRTMTVNKKSEQKLNLQPGEVKSLKGQFDLNEDWLELELSEDDYKFDNKMTLIKPELKKVRVKLDIDQNNQILADQLKNIYPAFEVQFNEDPQLLITNAGNLSSEIPKIIFYDQELPVKATILSCLSQEHDFVKNLSWQNFGMKFKSIGNANTTIDDRVLLWLDAYPLVFLREKIEPSNLNSYFELHCNFKYHHDLWIDPSFSLLIYRYLHSIIKNFPGFEAINSSVPRQLNVLERADQKIQLLWDDQIETEHLKSLKLSLSPKHQRLVIKQNETLLKKVAMQFSDSRESDFRAAKSERIISDHVLGETKINQRTLDPYVPLWIFILLSSLLLDWFLRRRVTR